MEKIVCYPILNIRTKKSNEANKYKDKFGKLEKDNKSYVH